MARNAFRMILFLGLVASCLFAAWVWFRPYAFGADPAARCKVVETLVTRDQSYYWVNIHLKVNDGVNHDLQKLVFLEVKNGIKLEPADTTFAGNDMATSREIWFRFWLENDQISSPLILHVNDGKLLVKATNNAVNLAEGEARNFTNNSW